MKRRTGRSRTGPAPGLLSGLLRRSLPLLLLGLFVVALAVPAGIAIAPVFRAADGAGDAPAPAPWQQAPAGPGRTGPDAVTPLTASAPVPDPGVLAARLNDTLKPDGAGTFSGVVQDAATGTVLFDRSGNEARVPASNMKLLTAIAALRSLGPDRRFSTTVVAGAAPGTVVLTGGGDVLLGAGESAPDTALGHAGLTTLAQATVRALQDDGAAGTLTVQLDDSLFTGPALNPAWSPADVAAGEVAPLAPLALNSARFGPAQAGPRPGDPAMAAAEAFSARLAAAAAAAGLDVAPGVERITPPAGEAAGGTRVLAEVQSATVGQQVDLFLTTSDNFLTEAVGRMAALASGRPGSNDGARDAVLGQLADLGIPTGGLHAADVSGLALANQVSARQLTEAVRAITSGTDPRLRAALAGFPVAGLSGTLAGRYADTSTATGAGLVRAKTGTLNTVAALSGYVVDADGRLLVFSFIGNGLAPGAASRAVLDRTASALAGCGCR